MSALLLGHDFCAHEAVSFVLCSLFSVAARDLPAGARGSFVEPQSDRGAHSALGAATKQQLRSAFGMMSIHESASS